MYFEFKSVILLASLSLAFYYDLRENKIKNSVTFPAAISGCIINFMESGGDGFLEAVKGWIIPVLILFICYSINVMGAGDIKLFAAIGAIMGYPFAIESIGFSICFGAVIALFLMVKRKQFVAGIQRVIYYVLTCLISKKLLCYSEKNDTTSKFPFSYAVFPSVVLQIWLVKHRI